MKPLFINCCYLWGMPSDLGLGVPYSNLLSLSSGSVRDSKTGSVLSSKNVFDPVDLNVLASVLSAYPQDSWVALDTEGMESRYGLSDKNTLDKNLSSFKEWANAVKSIKTLRPDLKVAVNCMWWNPDGANYNQNWVNWSMVDSCSSIFREILLPLIDGIMFECYFTNWSSGPAPTLNNQTFNFVGSSDYPKHGFLQHIDAWYNFLRGLAPGLPIFHLFALTHDSRSSDGEATLSPDELSWCLNTINAYQPFGIFLWGVFPKQNPHKMPDGWTIGTWDSKASWIGEIKKRL